MNNCTFNKKKLISSSPQLLKSPFESSVLRLLCFTAHTCLRCVIIYFLIPKSSEELSPPFLSPSARPVRLRHSHSECCIVHRSYKGLIDSCGKRRKNSEPAFFSFLFFFFSKLNVEMALGGKKIRKKKKSFGLIFKNILEDFVL